VRKTRTMLRAAVAAALALLVAACGDDGPARTAAEPAASAAPSSAAPAPAAFPVTVDNCGVTTTYQAAPKRAVAVEQSVVETMLALGLERSIVGISTRNQTEVRPDLAAAYKALPVLSARDFSRELLLAATPDIMVSRQKSSFREDRGLSRASLVESGINSHVLGQDCVAGVPTWDALYGEIRTLGRVFGVADRAERLVGEMRGAVADVESKVKAATSRPKVFLYDDSGEDVPGTRGGNSIDTLLVRTAGAENVFADVAGIFGNVSWEELVARNPDVVVVIEYGAGSGFEAQPRIDRLRNHPAARNITAVRENRIVVVNNHQLLLGIRNAEALRTIAKGIHPGLFG